MLDERSPREKEKHLRSDSRRVKQTKHADTENRLLVAQGGGRREGGKVAVIRCISPGNLTYPM